MKALLKLLIPGLLVLGLFLSCNNDDSDLYTVSKVTMSSDTLSLALYETRTITATVYPTTATDRSVEWYSSDETVVKMDSCYATATGVGEATLTVVTNDGGYTATCFITVTPFPSSYTSISDDGTANCYLIESTGTYCFDGTVRGNGATTDGLDAPSALSPSSVDILWQTDSSVVANAWLSEGLIAVKVVDYGNAVVAARNSSGDIIWSWHIWFPETEIYSLESSTGYSVMNVNIGAIEECDYHTTTADGYGLLYQWGRKDPFPSAADLDSDDYVIYDTDSSYVYLSTLSGGTIDEAIANPMALLLDVGSGDWLSSSNDYLWGNAEGSETDENGYFNVNLGEKTIYDPCPVGWRVASADVFRGIITEFGEASDYELFDVVDMAGDGVVDGDDFTYGWYANVGGVANFLPAAGYYYGASSPTSCGTQALYWSNSPASDSSAGYSLCALDADSSRISLITDTPRATAQSVRCVRDE